MFTKCLQVSTHTDQSQFRLQSSVLWNLCRVSRSVATGILSIGYTHELKSLGTRHRRRMRGENQQLVKYACEGVA